MEQSNGQTGHKEVDNSSSDEIDLELQDDEVNQECPQEQQVLSHLLEIGEYIDYLDSNHNKWLTMKILDIQTTNIRLLSPTTQNTFWIQFQYHIIRKQWIPGVPLQNTRVEIFHHGKGWLTGIVLQVEQDKAYIHHQGYKRIYDDYYSIKDIYPLGYNSNEPGIGKLLKQQPQSIHRLQHRFNLYLQLQNLLLVRKKYKEMETSLQSVLNEQGMVIREVQGDGNCMFRAISDQLYGNEMYHKELRKFAMQYILQEKDYFQDYIVNKNVEEYVEYKSKDGVWGDNIELQAFRELYDIPIEIYVCSKEPLKTGLESNPFNKEPIRLSYHGRSHYNSIKQKDKQHSALLGVLQINQYEKELFERFQEQKNKHGQQISRAQFENCISNELDIIFNESKRLFQDQQLQNEQTAIKESLQQLEYEEEEEQLMDMIMKESVQDAEFQQQEKLLLQVKQEQPQQQQQQQQQKQQQQQQQQQYQQQSNLENEILKKIMEQSKQEQEQQFIQQIEDTQFQTALKESEKNLYEDPLNNPTIAQVMTLGYFTLEQVLEGYAIHRDDPEMIINYLYENFQ